MDSNNNTKGLPQLSNPGPIVTHSTYKEAMDHQSLTEKEIRQHFIQSALDAGKRFLLKQIPGIGDALVDLQDQYNQAINKQKQVAVLEELFSRMGKSEKDIHNLIKFLLDPYGSSLFNKVKRIYETIPQYKEATVLLANVLDEIINSDFEKKFDKHSFFLEKIEKLSIHALIVLADHSNWPKQINLTRSKVFINGQPAIDNWYLDFAKEYSNQKGYSSPDLIENMELVVRELHNNGLIEIQQDGDSHKVLLTKQGDDLIRYLKK